MEQDARISNLKLSEEVFIAGGGAAASQATARDGLILGYEARLGLVKLGAGMMVFVDVILDWATHDAMNSFKAAARHADRRRGPPHHPAALRRAGLGRGPKIPVPTRTIVAPSAMAASRSLVMPIESVSSE